MFNNYTETKEEKTRILLTPQQEAAEAALFKAKRDLQLANQAAKATAKINRAIERANKLRVKLGRAQAEYENAREIVQYLQELIEKQPTV